MVNRTLLGLLLALLASTQLLTAVHAAPAPGTAKPIHLNDKRGNMKPVHINDKRGNMKPVHIEKREAILKPYSMLKEDSSRLNSRAPKPITLRPVRLDSFESPLRRRQISHDLTRLDLVNEAKMVYAAESEDRQGVMMANMTLYAPDGVPIIMMERFEGLTSAVDCEIESDGFIGLKFNVEKAFNYAREAWDWINVGDDDQFIIITDHEGCAPGSERKAYQ